MAILIEQPYRCTFLHAPKTGGTSVNNWLNKNFEVQDRSLLYPERHTHIRPLKLTHATFPLAEYHFKYNLGWTFSTVRNPYDWVVSWYTYRLKTLKQRVANLETNAVPPQLAARHKEFNLTHQKEKLAVLELGFEEWLRHPKTKLEQQVCWYGEADYVMRFENLVEDFAEVQERLGCDDPLPHLNASRADGVTYHDYYTSPDLIDIVSKKCDVDIALFNYTFD